jgi:hypothetical protein
MRHDLHRFRSLAPLAMALALTACADAGVEESSDDLTSVTALERKLSFQGVVYVQPGASEATILDVARKQTRSAFGALRESNVSVASRELAGIDIKTFVKEPVDIVDAKGVKKPGLRVRYTYVDQAIVPKTMSRKSSLQLGLLHGDYDQQIERILKECTGNGEHDHEFADAIWYVFNPALTGCRAVMNAEQAAIDQSRLALKLPKTQVVPAETTRLYLPTTVKLEPKTTAAGKAYPEYDRLWAGGIEKDKIVVALVNGEIDHAQPGETHYTIDDSGYGEMVGQMETILQAHPKLKIVATDPPTDMSSFTVNGKVVKGVGFQDFVNWERGKGFPATVTSDADRLALRRAVGDKLMKRWIVLEEPLTVKIGTAAARKVTLKIQQYFGAGSVETPHRRAIKTSDVILYNGHSYIGSGPWDPERYTAADFPSSYQIMFIDGCVSFNYYNKDYFGLKKRGSQDLETVTNGVESWSDGSGAGLARFLNRLVDGTQASYLDLLTAAGTQGMDYAWGKDALRVVDGELDNVYVPSKKKIVVTKP